MSFIALRLDLKSDEIQKDNPQAGHQMTLNDLKKKITVEQQYKAGYRREVS